MFVLGTSTNIFLQNQIFFDATDYLGLANLLMDHAALQIQFAKNLIIDFKYFMILAI